MKTSLAILMTLIVAASGIAGVYFYDHYKVAPTISTPASCTDPGSISSHVYNPGRLQLLKPCITASGIVDNVTSQADGDLHIRLNLDPAYSNLTTPGNAYEGGDLVVEIICANTPTQPDAIASCQSYTNQIPIPDTGQHITVTGPYVLDTNHHNWAEIHPVYSLSLPSGTTSVTITDYFLNISYPNSATNGWLGSSRSYNTDVTVSGGDQFTDTIVLNNTASSPQTITSITINNPDFTLVSVSPNTPITFGGGISLSVTITVQTPDSNFDGSLALRITTS